MNGSFIGMDVNASDCCIQVMGHETLVVWFLTYINLKYFVISVKLIVLAGNL